MKSKSGGRTSKGTAAGKGAGKNPPPSKRVRKPKPKTVKVSFLEVLDAIRSEDPGRRMAGVGAGLLLFPGEERLEPEIANLLRGGRVQPGEAVMIINVLVKLPKVSPSTVELIAGCCGNGNPEGARIVALEAAVAFAAKGIAGVADSILRVCYDGSLPLAVTAISAVPKVAKICSKQVCIETLLGAAQRAPIVWHKQHEQTHVLAEAAAALCEILIDGPLPAELSARVEAFGILASECMDNPRTRNQGLRLLALLRS